MKAPPCFTRTLMLVFTHASEVIVYVLAPDPRSQHVLVPGPVLVTVPPLTTASRSFIMTCTAHPRVFGQQPCYDAVILRNVTIQLYCYPKTEIR
jgi:hypothetical protein